MELKHTQKIVDVIKSVTDENTFMTYIIDVASSNLNGKLILDNDFIEVCNRLYADIRDDFISSINGLKVDEDAKTLNAKQIEWASSIFSRQVYSALVDLIDYTDVSKIYCTFDFENYSEDDEDIDVEDIPTYLVCLLLSELNIEVIADNKVQNIIKQYRK